MTNRRGQNVEVGLSGSQMLRISRSSRMRVTMRMSNLRLHTSWKNRSDARRQARQRSRRVLHLQRRRRKERKTRKGQHFWPIWQRIKITYTNSWPSPLLSKRVLGFVQVFYLHIKKTFRLPLSFLVTQLYTFSLSVKWANLIKVALQKSKWCGLPSSHTLPWISAGLRLTLKDAGFTGVPYVGICVQRCLGTPQWESHALSQDKHSSHSFCTKVYHEQKDLPL